MYPPAADPHWLNVAAEVLILLRLLLPTQERAPTALGKIPWGRKQEDAELTLEVGC